MHNSIFFKEWLKVRFAFLITAILGLITVIYFGFNLRFDFATIEPETMMWYRFAILGSKPYNDLIWLYILAGVIIAFAQFLPELNHKRIKLTVHLPLAMPKILFFHLISGFGFVFLLNILFSISLLFIVFFYYPLDVFVAACKDAIFYSFASVAIYTILSSAIIESDKKFIIFKLFFAFLFLFLISKDRYFAIDFFTLFLSIFAFCLLLLDSFYSIKKRRVSKPSQLIIAIFSIYMVFVATLHYQKSYQKEFHKYYIFYSDKLGEFVYQKNFGHHQFEYISESGTKFSQKEYESYLPFVYWKDLDIQNKLPITIDGVEYSKELIRDSRLGFEYDPKVLIKTEAEIYPLFNPQTNEGMIRFAEEFFAITNKSAKVYSHHGYDKAKSIELTTLLESHDFTFPAKHIWGKTTNLKPSDQGYLVLDSSDRLFNIKQSDDNLLIRRVEYPPNIEIAHANISENRAKKLSGYLIDKNSNFYLLSWDFELYKIELANFDHRKMRLRLIANPNSYLIRYDDGKSYFATRISKEDFGVLQAVRFD